MAGLLYAHSIAVSQRVPVMVLNPTGGGEDN